MWELNLALRGLRGQWCSKHRWLGLSSDQQHQRWGRGLGDSHTPLGLRTVHLSNSPHSTDGKMEAQGEQGTHPELHSQWVFRLRPEGPCHLTPKRRNTAFGKRLLRGCQWAGWAGEGNLGLPGTLLKYISSLVGQDI